MAIELVVNGYFRSGTTFIWDFLKSTLDESNYLSLYEPLSPEMAIMIRKEKQDYKNRLHNKFVFKDYLKLDEQDLLNILRNNPNANLFGIDSDSSLENYLDIFHTLNEKIFLQPNRMHFHLDLVFENYTKKVIHVIRHPLDVYLSITQGAYKLVDSKYKRLVHEILKPFFLVKSFEIEKQYQWINLKIGYPYTYKDSINLRVVNKFNTFEKFVVVWVVSNYYALKSIEKNCGLLVVYEDLLVNPNENTHKIASYLELELKDIPNVRKDNYFKFDHKLINKINKVVHKYSLDDEFKYILKQVNNISSIKWEI